MSTAIAAAAALVAAFCFAVGSVVQQGVAVREAGQGILSFRLLLSLVRQRRWVGGVLLPLIARRNQRPLTIRDAAGAFLVTAGLVIFLTVSAPHSGRRVPPLSAWLPALVAIGAVALGSALAAGRVRGPARVVWLAAAAGALYGLLDALTKSSVDILAVTGAHVLVTWEPYTMFVVAVFAALFGQSAYGSGALSLSLPVIDTVEPVAAVAIGATIFGERLASSVPLQVVQLAGGALAVGGIAVLSGSSVVQTETELAPTTSRPR